MTDTSTYVLRNTDNEEFASETKGSFGGHKALKIYGHLDCPNALRWIAKGHYVKYRVFFADEDIAQAAGFRPCGCCMKEKYQEWKAVQAS